MKNVKFSESCQKWHEIQGPTVKVRVNKHVKAVIGERYAYVVARLVDRDIYLVIGCKHGKLINVGSHQIKRVK